MTDNKWLRHIQILLLYSTLIVIRVRISPVGNLLHFYLGRDRVHPSSTDPSPLSQRGHRSWVWFRGFFTRLASTWIAFCGHWSRSLDDCRLIFRRWCRCRCRCRCWCRCWCRCRCRCRFGRFTCPTGVRLHRHWDFMCDETLFHDWLATYFAFSLVIGACFSVSRDWHAPFFHLHNILCF